MPKQYGDPLWRTQWAPKQYAAGPLEGPGRWVTIQSPIGVPAAILWTDDREILAFRAADMADNPDGPAMADTLGQALRSARAAGTPASSVFDWWAGQASMGLAAGAVTTGDLSELQGKV